MKIFLIRHGEQEYPHDEEGRRIVSDLNTPLVELGRIITTEAAKQTIEGFRNSGQTEAES